MTSEPSPAVVPAAEERTSAEILKFPKKRKGHARTSSVGARAAKHTSRSAVTPAPLAFVDAKTADHHSSGIRSLCHHLRTAVTGAPISNAMSPNEGQSAIMDRNEFGASIIESSLGQIVPKFKDFMSTDWGYSSGHYVRMGTDDDDALAESEWREQFKRRLVEARGTRTQADMAELLGFEGDHATNRYGKYEGRRNSMMPVRLLPKFAKICGVTLEWLIGGPPHEKYRQPVKRTETRPATKRGRKSA